MTVAEQIFKLLRTTEALLEGHFLLTSGQHSGGYVQCAKVLQYPQHAEALGRWIADSFRGTAVDVVISPAVGGIVIGQEVARALGVRAIFGEREGSVMTLRRGFEVTPEERVLVVEDVTTTGESVRSSTAVPDRSTWVCLYIRWRCCRSRTTGLKCVPCASRGARQ